MAGRMISRGIALMAGSLAVRSVIHPEGLEGLGMQDPLGCGP